MAKIFQYPKEKDKYSLETRLFVNIQLGVAVLLLFTFIVECFLSHYPDAMFVWIVGILLSITSIEMILREKFTNVVYFLTICSYILLVFLGIHYSGSILTPSVLFSFLCILIFSVIAKDVLKYLGVAAVISSVIYHSISEMNTQNIPMINREVYIDWAVYFTVIALIVVWIVSKVIVILRNYNETIKKANDELYYSSITDPLTQVFNRNFLNEYSENLLKNQREKNSFAVMLMIDIDFFKKYNDNYGHIAGDKCLQSVASVLKRSLHRSDDMVFRIGGEEFLILLSGIKKEHLGDISDRVHSELAKEKIEHKESPVSPFITVSIGAVLFDINQNKNLEQIFRIADAALYKAKEAGRNRTEEVILLSDL